MKRADLEKWSNVASKSEKNLEQARPRGPLCVRDLRGVLKLEDWLLIYGPQHPNVTSKIADLSRSLFAIDPAEVEQRFPEGFDYELYDEFLDGADESAEADLNTGLKTGSHLTDDEIVEALLTLGVDFSDCRGQPLLCTKLLCRIAEVAARGLMGTLPDHATTSLQRWEDSIREDAYTFLTLKRGKQLTE